MSEGAIPEARIASNPGTPLIIISPATNTTNSTPYVIQSPSPIPAADLVEQL